MERYEAYKDSGVEWIGEIPVGWKTHRLKHMASNRVIPAESEAGRYLGLEQVQSWTMTIVYEAEDEADTAGILYDEACVMFGKLRPYLAKVALPNSSGPCSSEFLVLQPLSIKRSYLAYTLVNKLFISEVNAMTYGVRMPRVGWDLVGNLQLPVPPEREQERIADYLDDKTAEIDAIVADCEREVELLKEYRKAVISEAVTKGLDPDVPMKDSGVKWIGEIPTGWQCTKLGLISVSTLGRMLDTEKQTGDCLAPYLSNRDVQWFHIDDSDLKEMDFPYEMRGSYEIRDGDMLVCEGGEVGRSAVWHGPTPSFYFQKAIHRVRFDTSVMNPAFAAYQMFQKAQVTMFREVRKGESTIGHLPGDQLRQLTLIVPPLDEQHDIVTRLDAKTAEIDSLIEAKQSMVDKLREYRRSLISEAVTGKFKVPGV